MRVAFLSLSVLATTVACGANPSNDKLAFAAINAGAAGVLYATWGGCKHAGCPTHHACNAVSERCERMPCGGDCEGSERCEVATDRCVPR